MTLITIRENKVADANALLVFDGGEQYSITIANPLTEQEEKRLEWYFEQHLRFPFIEQVRAQEAASSITAYGETLFKQVFADPDAYASYKAALQEGVEHLAFEVAGSPEFHAFHWEAVKDPRSPQPLALQATMVRRKRREQGIKENAQRSPGEEP